MKQTTKQWKRLYSAHQKSGDRVKNAIQFYGVITYTFVLKLRK